MNCEAVRTQLVALRDNELTEDAAANVRAHLADCPQCAGLRQEFEGAVQMAGAWDVEGADVWPSVRGCLTSEEILTGAEVRMLHEEMRGLRAEIHRLREDVAELRRQLTVRQAEPMRPSSQLLFPLIPTNDVPRCIL